MRKSEEEIVVEINNFITHIKLSEARRPRYYTKKSKIPKRFINPVFDEQGYLLNDEGGRVISNTRSVGTPRLWAINGQSLYSGLNGHTRNTVVKKLKEYFSEKLKYIPKIEYRPITLELDVYRYPGYYDEKDKKWKDTFDLDNYTWILRKSIQDVLADKTIQKIEDDNVNIIDELNCKFYPVCKNDPIKLVIKIKKSGGRNIDE